MVFTITWSRQTRLAAFISPILGLVLGLVVWTTTAYHYYGEVTVASLGEQLPCMFGGLTSLFLPGISSILISLSVKPYSFDWSKLREVEIIVTETNDISSNFSNDRAYDNSNTEKESIEKRNQITNTKEQSSDTDSNNLEFKEDLEDEELKRRLLNTYLKLGYGAFVFALLITWVLWPLPLYRDWIWSKEYFKGYITVSLIWVYGALLVIGVYPLIDGRHSAAKIMKGLYNDLTKKK